MGEPIKTNGVNVYISDDKRTLTLAIYLEGEEKTWLNFDSEQLDALLALLHRSRGKMVD